MVLKPKETKQSFCKRLSKELLFFLLGVCLLSAWCALSFNHGKDSLSSEKSESFFPEAYMNSKYEKTYRLAWITGENFFWLDCNEIQPQLIGVRNDIQFYIRRLGANAINTICSKSN